MTITYYYFKRVNHGLTWFQRHTLTHCPLLSRGLQRPMTPSPMTVTWAKATNGMKWIDLKTNVRKLEAANWRKRQNKEHKLFGLRLRHIVLWDYYAKVNIRGCSGCFYHPFRFYLHEHCFCLELLLQDKPLTIIWLICCLDYYQYDGLTTVF